MSQKRKHQELRDSNWVHFTLVSIVRVYLHIFNRTRFHYFLQKQELNTLNPLIVFGNHNNFLVDAFTVGLGALPRRVYFIGKSTLFKNILVAKILKMGGAFPIFRKKDGVSTDKNHEVLMTYAHAVNEGRATAIYPEGTCTDEILIQKFYPGISKIVTFILQKEEKCYLIPVFSFYYNREDFFNPIDVFFLDKMCILKMADTTIFIESLRSTLVKRQDEIYQYHYDQLSSLSAGLTSISMEQFIRFHQFHPRVFNLLISVCNLLLKNKKSCRENIFGVISVLLFPFAIICFPIFFTNQKLAEIFAVDRSEISTYKMAFFCILLVAYSLMLHFFLDWDFIHLSIVFAGAYCGMMFHRERQYLLLKIFHRIFGAKKFSQLINYWIVKASK